MEEKRCTFSRPHLLSRLRRWLVEDSKAAFSWVACCPSVNKISTTYHCTQARFPPKGSDTSGFTGTISQDAHILGVFAWATDAARFCVRIGRTIGVSPGRPGPPASQVSSRAEMTTWPTGPAAHRAYPRQCAPYRNLRSLMVNSRSSRHEHAGSYQA